MMTEKKKGTRQTCVSPTVQFMATCAMKSGLCSYKNKAGVLNDRRRHFRIHNVAESPADVT